MARSKLVLIVALVAVAAGVTWLASNLGDPPTESLSTALPAESQEEGGEASTDPLTAGDAEHSTVEARSAVAEVETVAGLDPEIEAALAGFIGRVLHHDGQPAANTRVVLYRIDPGGLLGEIGDLLGSEILDPDVDAGDAVTDAEGRFAIDGVWPRGLYLLHAGVDTENPTLEIVERTPGGAEIIDLGDIYLRHGAVVTGTVLGDDDGPLEGALVRVVDLPAPILQLVALERFDPEGAILMYQDGVGLVVDMPPWAGRRFEQLPLPSTRTGADGTFRVTGIEPVPSVLLVTAAGHASLQQPGLELEAGRTTDVGTLYMDRGETVRGQVTDERGLGVAGAEVLLGHGGSFGVVFFAPRALTTDQRGDFSAVGFQPGKVIAAARRQPGDRWMVTAPQSATNDFLVQLPVGHDLTLRLTSSSRESVGEPRMRLLPGKVGDGAVELARFGFSNEIDLEQRLERLEDGRYRIGDLPAGRYTLLVEAEGHALRGVQVELQGVLAMTVTLEPEVPFAVRTLHTDGTPVRSAAVYVEARRPDGRTGDLPVPRGRTGPDGFLALDGVSRGDVRLSARHPKYGWTHARAEVPGPEIVLTFDTPGAIDGVLTEDGELPALGKWTITAERRGQNGSMPELPRLAVADVEGKFRIGGLQPGEYRLSVMESFQRFASAGSLVQGMSAQMVVEQNDTLVLIQAGETARVVLDAVREREVEGPSARVSGSVLVNGRPAEGMVMTGWGPGRATDTVDASGRFDLGQVAEGQLYLRLVDPEQSNLFGQGHLWSQSFKIVANEDRDLEIAVDTAELAGRVLGPDGAAVSGALVRANGGLAAEGGRTPGSASFRTVTGAEGRFQFDGVPAGRYNIRVELGEEARGTLRRIEVSAGRREVEVRLRSTVKLEGFVDMSVFGDQTPTRMWLNLLRETEHGVEYADWAQVAADGSFSSARLVPDTYLVRLSAFFEGGQGNREYEGLQPIEVGEQGVQGVTLKLKPR